MRKLLIIIFIMITSNIITAEEVVPAVEGEIGQQVFDDLAKYYNTKELPPYQKMLDLLSSEDEKQRELAGGYIYALFVQLLDDETNGRTKWEKTPFFNGEMASDARHLRESVPSEFSQKASGIQSFKAAMWLINKDPDDRNQAQGIIALRHIKGEEAEDALKEIIKGPHPNENVTVGAIEEIGERNLTSFAPEVVRLHNHYRYAIREAVITTLNKLNITERLPEFEPEKAFTPSLEDQLKKASEMVLIKIPENSKWYNFEYTDWIIDYDGTKKPYTHQYIGWLLGEDDKNYHILTCFSSDMKLPKSDTKIYSSSLKEIASSLLELRKKGIYPSFSILDREDEEARPSYPAFVSVPELLIAAWSFERGDKKTTADIFFQCINRIKDDRHLPEYIRDLMGDIYHQEMLRQFTYFRDYELAITLGEHLSKPLFNGYHYQERARELAEQLQNRKDDFKAFTLPTEAEWIKIKVGMNRQEQIDFLVQHLRLLNCFQMSQPGGINYRDAQTSKTKNFIPQKDFTQKGYEKHKTEIKRLYVINPFNELMALNLKMEDLPYLIPYFEDESFMPTFSYHRDFFPDRSLHRVNWVIANIINKIAKRYLTNPEKYHSLDEKRRKQYIAEISAWYGTNANKTKEELLLATIESTSEREEFWNIAGEAVQEGFESVAPILIKRAEDFPRGRAGVSELLYKLNMIVAVPIERNWLEDKDEETLVWTALTLLSNSTPDNLEGLSELKAIFGEDEGSYWYSKAIEGLLLTKKEPALELAAGILKKRKFEYDLSDENILKNLFLAGRKECLEYLISKLDSKEKGKFEGYLESDEVSEMLTRWRTDGFKYNIKMSGKERKQKQGKLKKWLQDQFALIKQGKNPDMKTDPVIVHSFVDTP
jgi:hypothetical protein